MSGAGLGGGRCQQCGGPITGKGRRDRKHCSVSCRTVAWSERSGKDSGKSSIRGSATQLDDRVVDRLADALALRFTQGDTVPAARRPDPLPVAAAPVIESESEAIRQLQAEMAKLRTELELSRASPSTTPGSQRATAALRLVEEATLGPPSHQPVTGQPRAVKLLAGGQAGGTVVASAAQFPQLKAAHRQERAAIDKDHEQLTRNFSALFLAHNKLEMAPVRRRPTSVRDAQQGEPTAPDRRRTGSAGFEQTWTPTARRETGDSSGRCRLCGICCSPRVLRILR